MKLKVTFLFLFIFALVLGYSMQSHAELIVRGADSLGYQLIYDSDRNITWYDYTKSADNWQNQMNWVGSLDINFGGSHYTDWRLPTSNDCAGNNCINSEMGHLYYVDLGNSFNGGNTITTGSFQDLRKIIYWSSTTLAGIDRAWHFDFSNGDQKTEGKGFSYPGYYGLAVRYGDVSVTVVPEPISSILFLTGGILLAGRRYLKRKV